LSKYKFNKDINKGRSAAYMNHAILLFNGELTDSLPITI